MKKWSLKKKIFIGILAMLVIAQFFRVDQTNPKFDASQDFIAMVNAPDDMAGILKGACYDCHSYETEYPWYFNISPFSFWLKGHVNGGRQNLNFSEWGSYDAERKSHKIDEIMEEVKGKEMPLASFMLTHPEARLTDVQRTELVSWFGSLPLTQEKSSHDDHDHDDDDDHDHDH